MRSSIHGITADILNKASAKGSLPAPAAGSPAVSQLPICSLRQAQALILSVCTSATILVGQSLHNDLKALKFDHK
jgi:hypothetical protein